MIRIPLDSIGYKVDGSTIHTRYADHGNGERTRTVKGVLTLLDGKQAEPCERCYPAPRFTAPRYASTTPAPPQKRRSGTKRKKAK